MKRIIGLITSLLMIIYPSLVYANNGGVGLKVDKNVKLDIMVDELNDHEGHGILNNDNLCDDINQHLHNLDIRTDDINYYRKSSDRVFKDYSINDTDVEDEGNYVSPNKASFSNTEYNKSQIEILKLEDINPDEIEHTCSFISTSNNKYCWQYCTMCGESAEFLEKLNNNKNSKPTDNGDNTKGNINIKEHKYDNNKVVVHGTYRHCGLCYIYGYCSCGRYGEYGRTFDKKELQDTSCKGCMYTGCNLGPNVRTGRYGRMNYHSGVFDIEYCRNCSRTHGINGTCASTPGHYVSIPTTVNSTATCLCGRTTFKLLAFEVSSDKANQMLIIKAKCETNRSDADFNRTVPFSEENNNINPSSVTVSSKLLSSSGGKYIYEYTFNVKSQNKVKVGSSLMIIRELWSPNFQINFSYYDFPASEFVDPTISNITATPMKLEEDDKGNAWVTQTQYTITGTENDYLINIKIEDMNGKVYYDGQGTKDGNNYSATFMPYIEANVKKTLKAVAYDRSGNTSKPYYFDIDTTDNRPPEIISELDYRDNWKNKIIFKAEVYEGGVGLTQIALNKSSDFKIVNKIENPDKSGNDIYYRYYAFQGDIYGDDFISPILFAKDGLNHLDSKKILIGKLDSTKPTIENIDYDPSTNNLAISANDRHPTKGEGSGITKYAMVPKGKYPTIKSFMDESNIHINRSGSYDIYVMDKAGNISEPFNKTINLKESLASTNNMTIYINITNEEDNSLISPNKVADILNKSVYYINWTDSKNYNFYQDFNAIIDDKGRTTYFVKDDVNYP